MERTPQMTSSFDKKEASGPPFGKHGIESSLHADSHSQSQPSVTEISLMNTVSKSFDDSLRNAGFQRGGGLYSSIPTFRRDASSTWEESDEDVWREKNQRDDPVGDVITNMLNEGKVPYFGYSKSLIKSSVEPATYGFKLSPLFSARNYRAMRTLILATWNNGISASLFGEQGNMDHESQSMRFLLESFAVCYIAIYSVNDIVLRSLSEFTFFTVLGTVGALLFELEEVKYASLSLISSATSYLPVQLVHKCNAVARGITNILERELLWGYRFEGRILFWSDEERLIKFRRKHRRLMATNNERRQNRKDRKKSRKERKRREKRGEPFSILEIEMMEKEIQTKEQLEDASKQLTLKPPTFFSDKVDVQLISDISLRTDATKLHLQSLQYCHKMIVIDSQDQASVKPVEIMATLNDNRISAISHRSTISPREAIEVVDPFPDVGSDINLDNHFQPDDALSTNTSVTSYSVNYDDQSDYSSGEEDDMDSLGSYASESTTRSMPWMVVGAKIGHKILTARKLRRVIANPDAAQKLIPDEAKKLIDDLNNDISPESCPSPEKANSWEGPEADTRGVMSPRKPGLPQSNSMDLPEMKPPVHGMWTSAGSAAKAPNSYGAVTLGASPPRGQLEKLSHVENQRHANSSFASPSRRPLNGLRAPPPSPAVEYQGNSHLVSQQGEDALGYATPPQLTKKMTISTPNNKEAEVTPRHCNSTTTRKLFSVSETEEPPVPVTRLAPIDKGVKVVIPMFPPNNQTNASIASGSTFFQMGTVVSSRRIYIPPNGKQTRKRKTNCLSIKVVLDKALLRGSKFVEANLRIMDEWNYIPRHSKFPIGSCVATQFGIGVLVGWRVEDDMHIIRLWKRSGQGSGLSYLRRDSVHSSVEAAIGFDVQTTYGAGKVVAYVRGGKKNTTGKYFVRLNGRNKSRVMEFSRCQILSCQGATFTPVTEHIRAAALYRLEVLHYKAKLREKMLNGPSKGIRAKGMWRNFSEYVDLFANSFSKAIAEDPDFDSEVDKFFSHIISLLDGKKDSDVKTPSTDSETCSEDMVLSQSTPEQENVANKDVLGWNINDMFGCFFVGSETSAQNSCDNQDVLLQAQAFEEAHDSAEILIRVLLRTIMVAKTSVPDRPKLHIALAMIHEALLFVRQILHVQKKHTSKSLIEAWFRALNELSDTFGPVKQRMAALGVQIAKKFRKHGSIAKRRLLRFVDIVLGDTQLLHSLELGDWKKALSRIEHAIVMADITDAATCEQLHKGAVMLYKNLAPTKKDRKSKAAAARNGQKMVNFAKIMKVIASPGRSFMRLLARDEALSLFDRILVRVFEKDPHCSSVINIYAFNFDSIRHLRTLNNMSIAGKLWETVLDAIDEELTFATSEIPDQTKYFIEPIVKLFSLGVSQFHSIQSGGSTADWLEFLMEDDSVEIIQELDYKLIDSLEALCNDIKQVVQVLPYIKTIDDDILNLMDEFNFDIFLKDISDIITDPEQTMAFITDRSAILVERFLDYLPRMSIPIERRELQDGWVLTCRSKDGGDLRLSDLSVLRENLLLSVLGGENVFHPSSGKEFIGSPGKKSPVTVDSDLTDDEEEEESVIDDIREMILSSQAHGSWIAGVGDLKEPHHYKGLPRQLTGLPMSDKLKSQIDLWQTSSITDFELLETAIREVSYQIQLQKEREEKGIELPQQSNPSTKCFNPKLDPTVLFLDIKNLTLLLEEFGFRVEKGEPLTVFDPVFEGSGSITVKNVSITLKVEVKKERVFRRGIETPRPVLQLAKFEVELEKVQLEFKETGADWILNAVLKGFSGQITEIVKDNLKEQIVKQVHILLEQVNGFIDTNPDLLMNALGITMNDLDESIVCV
ncbi:hypothetical protein ACHAXR_012357 [Thalassiosira sp. AJA248-18]